MQLNYRYLMLGVAVFGLIAVTANYFAASQAFQEEPAIAVGEGQVLGKQWSSDSSTSLLSTFTGLFARSYRRRPAPVPTDTTRPVITLVGEASVSVARNSTYIDAGATATDNKDGDITSKIVRTGSVNTSKADTYRLRFNVKDAAGNAANQKTRTVTVTAAPAPAPTDTTKPVITLNGSASVSVTAGANYSDAGATASDNKDGNITSKIVVTGSVNTAIPGTYSLYFNVKDAAGNAANQKTRTVTVTAAEADTTPPVITLTGSSSVSLTVNTSYSDAGATATDNVDGDITGKIAVTGMVNTATVGTYYMYFNVKDVAGNAAVQKVRTITVTTEPVPAPVSTYPLHTAITATVFWVGEPQGNGSSEDNALSAWDDEWQKNYGGYDDYENRNGYYPVGFTPKENPFYLDLPYNDFNNNGTPKSNRITVVPWANEKSSWGKLESMMKNRWVKLVRNGITCYGQIEDAGPYQYDDYNYVFGTTDPRPKSTTANNAGMDVSPALRDCLKFQGLNNASNKVDWQFVDFADVPEGPWREIITTSQVNWP